MINPYTQSAFRRVDTKLGGYLNSPSSPAILRLAYSKVKSFMIYMASMEDPSQRAANAPGPGGLLRSCEIF